MPKGFLQASSAVHVSVTMVWQIYQFHLSMPLNQTSDVILLIWQGVKTIYVANKEKIIKIGIWS